MKKFLSIFSLGMVLLSTINSNAIGDNDLHKAVIKNMLNKVEVKYGVSEWRVASINQLLRPGTSVRTGPLAKMELLYPDGTVTRLGSRTAMTILDKDIRSVKLDSGKLWFKVTKKSAGLRIYSPTAVAAITGTEGFASFNDQDKQSNISKTRLASGAKNFSVAEAAGQDSFQFGLIEGSANVYKSADDQGNPAGDPIQVLQGQLLTLGSSDFTMQDIGINDLKMQNIEISEPDMEANVDDDGNMSIESDMEDDDPADSELNPSNPSTEQIPNSVNDEQDLKTSPTTGDLIIIIK